MGDRYEIKEKIGQGGLGEVYRAIDSQLKREVALKRLLPPGEGEASEVDSDTLLTEATTLSSLQHPNIVSVYDVGSDSTGPFVVMELLKGETFDVTVERGALTEKDFRNVVSQTMEALVAAHHSDIIHRDLKPSNLMVNWLPSGKFQIKILDFGLAKFGKTPEVQTTDQGDAILGSIYFMAPEQFERVPLDARTDLYSIGALYHYSLTGQYPFDGETAPQVMAAHLQNRVQWLHELRPDLPRWMCDWVMWLVSREMSDRPASAQAALNYFNEERSDIKGAPQPVARAGSPVLAVAPAQAAAPPVAGARTAPLGAAAMGGIPVAQATGPLTAHGDPGAPGAYGAQAPRKAAFPIPIWAVITIPVLLITLLVVYLTKSGAKRVLDERNAEVVELNQAEVPRGDADTVAMIVEFMKDQDNTSNGKNNVVGALTTLSRLVGSEVDGAVLAEAEKAPSKLKAGLFGVLIDRGVAGAIPLMLKNVDSKSADVSKASIYGLGALGGGDNVPTLIKELETTRDEKIAAVLSQAIIEIARKNPDLEARSKAMVAAYDSAPTDEFQWEVLRILGSLGGESAWKVIQRALGGSVVDAKKAALRGLGNWPDGIPADRVYEIAVNDEDGVVRGMALRTFAHLALAPSAVPEEDRLVQVSKLLGMENVARSSKRDLLQVVASMATPAAMDLADGLVDDQQLASYSKMVADSVDEQLKKRQSVGADGLLVKASNGFVRGEEGSGFKYSSEAAAVTGWSDLSYYVWWPLEFTTPGTYEVIVKLATPPVGGGTYALTLSDGRLLGKTPAGKKFAERSIGEIEIAKPGTYRLNIEGASMAEKDGSLMQLRSVELKAN